ncbi:TPA: ribosome biogenesis protein [Candidatus Woesearchaeota archaeon]|nr:ribosome biogenesis protein [Candidatus Woesearchaeota archaeon]
MKHILRRKDGTYTLREEEGAASPKPPKFSLDDRYASYTRIAKEQERRAKGLL